MKHEEIITNITEKPKDKQTNCIYKLQIPRNTSVLESILQILVNKCKKRHCIDLNIDGGTNICKLFVFFFRVKAFATLPCCVPISFGAKDQNLLKVNM